jgi:hypothetical protein
MLAAAAPIRRLHEAELRHSMQLTLEPNPARHRWSSLPACPTFNGEGTLSCEPAKAACSTPKGCNMALQGSCARQGLTDPGPEPHSPLWKRHSMVTVIPIVQ